MIELADGGAGAISASEEMLSEISKVMLILIELGNACKYAINSLNIIHEGETYLGKAKDELETFYSTYSKHISTLISLYEKVYTYSFKAIEELMYVDRNILSAGMAENQDDHKILSRVMNR